MRSSAQECLPWYTTFQGNQVVFLKESGSRPSLCRFPVLAKKISQQCKCATLCIPQQQWRFKCPTNAALHISSQPPSSCVSLIPARNLRDIAQAAPSTTAANYGSRRRVLGSYPAINAAFPGSWHAPVMRSVKYTRQLGPRLAGISPVPHDWKQAESESMGNMAPGKYMSVE